MIQSSAQDEHNEKAGKMVKETRCRRRRRLNRHGALCGFVVDMNYTGGGRGRHSAGMHLAQGIQG